MNIVIRADASLVMGSGHIMRCLTLANALRQQGHSIHFICREQSGHLADAIAKQGFAVTLLSARTCSDFTMPFAHSQWLGMSENDDFADCAPLLQSLQPDWLIIDHYAISRTWQGLAKQLLPHVKILVIDDLADRPHLADILLDQTFGRHPQDYQGLVPSYCRLLLGTRYALLRDEFGQWREISLRRRQQTNFAVKNILVNLGGVDNDNVTLAVLRSLTAVVKSDMQMTEIKVIVVMGATAPHIASVQAFAASAPYTCQVVVNADNMAELMANADIAIGAAGSTTWERCALGLPMVLLVLADNQRFIAEALTQAKLVTVIDDSSQLSQQLPIAFQQLQDNLSRFSKKIAQTVDGKGATRVANHLGLTGKTVQVRKATFNDVVQVWQWRNHPDVRQYMFGQDEIALADHEKWFTRQLTLSNVTLLIFEVNHAPMGFVNFTCPTIDKYQTLNNHAQPKDTASWGFYLAPNSPKGQGLGYLLGVLAISYMFSQPNPVKAISAQVLDYNSASLALHRKLGFQETGMLKQHFAVADKTYDVVEFELSADNFLY